jgi:hypothetical protein
MKKITFFIVLTFLVLIFNKSKASHIAGADLTYKWVSGNIWEISLTLYRDCYGIVVNNSESVHFYSATCSQSFSASVSKIAGTGVEITNACPTNPSTCSGGPSYGIQEYIYRTTVTLQPCSDWTIYWCSCCRNAAITTVNDADFDGIFVMATLNNTSAATLSGNPNSSPSFLNKPNFIITNNQTNLYNHGASDIDGDSLVYSLVNPYDEGPSPFNTNCSGNGSASVIYLSPWTAMQPLTSNPPVSIDPNTGDIFMHPTLGVRTVMAVLVEEYRNGIRIGSVLRDMQATVLNDANHLPTLSGIDTSATAYNPNDTIYTWDMLLGNTIDFDVFANDLDITQPYNNLILIYNNSIPAASWNVTGQGTPNAIGHFSWTPSSADVSSVPHCFTVQVYDQSCPYYGMQSYSYCITVNGSLVSIDHHFSNNNYIGNISFDINPNPAGEYISIDFTEPPIDGAVAELFGVDGKLLQCISLQQMRTAVNISELNAGIYIVKVTGSNGVGVMRMIKE